MLNKKVLIEKLGEEYKPMLNKISIPDFTKCIAQYSGLHISEVKDEVIEEYLSLWAKNKKHIFDLMGDIRFDMPIKYVDEDRQYDKKLIEVGKQFPAYYPWLKLFRGATNNKIDTNNFYWQDRDMINELFPGYRYEGMALTRFFKQKLDAPDELITALGRVWENSTVEATFTLSIDPVDIMLSSENPYDWVSCYRLEWGCEDSHADGCLAGVLDSATIITYAWNAEGKYSLYGNYEFKNIRYKRMRMTIGVNKDFTAIHFNTIYPGKSDYSDSFRKLLRNKVETYFANKINKENVWISNDTVDWKDRVECSRYYDNYGYSEYSACDVYMIKGEKEHPDITPYNEIIHCPCGCGENYRGSDCDRDYWYYNGDGHINENWSEEGYYCEYSDEREDCDGDCGPDCPVWCRNNMVCELDENEGCDRNCWDAEDDGDFDPYRGNVVRCNPENCKECPLYKYHKQAEQEDRKFEEQRDKELTEHIEIGDFTISFPASK